MTDLEAPPDEADPTPLVDASATSTSPPPPTAPAPLTTRRRPPGLLGVVVRWTVALTGALVVFALFIALRGEDPVAALSAVWESAAGDSNAIGETLVRAAPLLLGALAVVVPARAGLFNIGGEGQLIMGAVGATGMSQLLDGAVPTAATLVLMAAAGAAAGAGWAGIAAVLRHVFATNEAITTLLLNYLAAIVLTWLVFEPWKDPASLGQAYSTELDDRSRFAVLWGDRVHVGVVIALVAAVVVWFALRRTRWGFRLGVLGGNAEAARRSGLGVGGLAVGAMVLGGALGGLGGVIEVAGVEGRLRPDLLAGFGYAAFLASWLARHDPLKAIAASILLGGIVVGGFGLKIATGLSGGAVNVLTALVLLGVLGFAQTRESTA